MKLLRPEHHLEEEKDFLKGDGDDVAVDDDISHGGSGDGDTNGEKEERGGCNTFVCTGCLLRIGGLQESPIEISSICPCQSTMLCPDDNHGNSGDYNDGGGMRKIMVLLIKLN